jgi:hypothetical protein
LYATTEPKATVTGASGSARPGTEVVHARSIPCGAYTASVKNGFVQLPIACGRHANDQMKIPGSGP